MGGDEQSSRAKEFAPPRYTLGEWKEYKGAFGGSAWAEAHDVPNPYAGMTFAVDRALNGGEK